MCETPCSVFQDGMLEDILSQQLLALSQSDTLLIAARCHAKTLLRFPQ